jgi:hypothetical protein
LSLFQAFLGFDDKSAQKSESIAKARNRPVLGVHVVYARCLITTGAVQRRNAAVPHLVLVLQATWWVVDISADTANIRCHIIVGCAPNQTMPMLLL